MKAYIYNADTLKIIEEIEVETNAQAEQYFNDNYDQDLYGLTYSPAFGTAAGLKY